MKNYIKYLFIVFIVVILLPQISLANTNYNIDFISRSEQVEKISTADISMYYVQPGDTLYKISIKFGITVNDLKRTNNLTTDLIYPGQGLIIPGKDNNTGIEYSVKPGDSLYKISLNYGITIEELRTANNLTSNMIYIGQKLIIPIKNNEEKKIGGRTINGKVIINNKTWGSTNLQKENDTETEVLPLTVNEDDNPPYSESEIIVKYKPLINSQSVDEVEEANDLVTISRLDTNSGNIVQYKINGNKDMEEVINNYKELDIVEWAEPNYLYYPTAIPSDRYYDKYQWNYINLNLEAAWDLQQVSKSVTVAVLDTGILPEHPDLKGNLLSGIDFVGGNRSYPIESYDITDRDPTDETTLSSGGSHGTHVSGIIGAVTDNNLGVAGINWKVNLLPVRVITREGGTSWDIAEGIYYAIDKGADIINFSLGGRYGSNLQQEAIRAAYEKGITIIAATGNEGSDVYYPAAYPETIAVGAVGSDNQKTSYSNYGPEVDVVAPGGAYGELIYSTWGYYDSGNTISSYTGMIGTSMATPHVSGIAALLVASGIRGPENIRQKLTSTTIDLGKAGKDNYYGYGLVDAYAALLGRKLPDPVIFSAELDSNILNATGNSVKVEAEGKFSINNVDDNSVIVAWRDVNNNGIVDQGDYYGSSKVIAGIDNMEIKMYYVSSGSDQPYFKVNNL